MVASNQSREVWEPRSGLVPPGRSGWEAMSSRSHRDASRSQLTERGTSHCEGEALSLEGELIPTLRLQTVPSEKHPQPLGRSLGPALIVPPASLKDALVRILCVMASKSLAIWATESVNFQASAA